MLQASEVKKVRKLVKEMEKSLRKLSVVDYIAARFDLPEVERQRLLLIQREGVIHFAAIARWVYHEDGVSRNTERLEHPDLGLACDDTDEFIDLMAGLDTYEEFLPEELIPTEALYIGTASRDASGTFVTSSFVLGHYEKVDC